MTEIEDDQICMQDIWPAALGQLILTQTHSFSHPSTLASPGVSNMGQPTRAFLSPTACSVNRQSLIESDSVSMPNTKTGVKSLAKFDIVVNTGVKIIEFLGELLCGVIFVQRYWISNENIKTIERWNIWYQISKLLIVKVMTSRTLRACSSSTVI